MRAKSKKRIQAEKLRREHGLTYNEISEMTGVSKSTLSNWLKNILLTPEQEARIQQRVENNRAAFVARAWRINKKRFQQAREKAFLAGAESVSQLQDEDSIDELALAMLYLGEGDKTGNRVQIASTDPLILRYFLWACRKLYGIGVERFSFRLNLVDVARPMEAAMKDWWIKWLSCSESQFLKTQFDSRSKYVEITGNYHGVCTITYNDTYIFQRLLGVYSTYISKQIGE